MGDQHDIRCPIPRRRNDLDDPERGMIFVCSATHKTKSMFFFLAQTEQGKFNLSKVDAIYLINTIFFRTSSIKFEVHID